jgi:hypothetical protein
MSQQQEGVFAALIVMGIDTLTALAATSGDEPGPMDLIPPIVGNVL